MSKNLSALQPEARHAWREVSRVEPAKRGSAERVNDFAEVFQLLDAATAQEQASRCVQCPTPPCTEGCPLGNPISEWLALTAEGRFTEALERMRQTGCMPEIVSKLCRQSCEQACVLERVNEPVAINAIEQFLTHYALSVGGEMMPPSPNGRKVAVIGSGPCGLACAHDLLYRGYSVTVFETQPVAGGLRAFSLPDFRIHHEVVTRRIRLLRELGIDFQLNMPVRDLALDHLRDSFDAIYLGVGPEEPRPLDIKGADLDGVHQALTFLLQQHPEFPVTGPEVDVTHKRVIVLGGGDTAMDCLRTAVRCGAREAVGIYRRSEGSLPCHPRDYTNALEEGVSFEFNALPIAITGTPDGRVSGLRCVRTQPGPADETGRPTPLVIDGSEFEIPAEVVLVAYGYAIPSWIRQRGFEQLESNERGEVITNGNHMTSVPGVFAGGVLVKKTLSLPETVRDARETARDIESWMKESRKRSMNGNGHFS